MKKRRLLLLLCNFLLLLLFNHNGNAEDKKEPLNAPSCAPSVKIVTMRGDTFIFGPPGGRIKNAKVTVLEYPELSATTDEKGAFEISGIAPCAEATLLLQSDEVTDVQTKTFFVENENIEQISFQTPADSVFKFLAALVKVKIDNNACQIASTVTRKGASVYTSDLTHGEPDATVTIEPPLTEEYGPIYFQYVDRSVVLPDRKLKKTTIDGGVLFVNVPPGEYVMHAHKKGIEFTPVKIKCVAGRFINAAPPHGLQAK